MNRRQLLLGTAAIAGATALPATAPAALHGDQEVHRLLDQMLYRRMQARVQAWRRYDAAGRALFHASHTSTPDDEFERVYEVYLKACDETDALFTRDEKLDYLCDGRVPADVVAIDPTWQQPRDDG